jgi:hypothetical protein
MTYCIFYLPWFHLSNRCCPGKLAYYFISIWSYAPAKSAGLRVKSSLENILKKLYI